MNLDTELARMFRDAQLRPVSRKSHEEIDASLRAEADRQKWADARLPVVIAELEASDTAMHEAMRHAVLLMSPAECAALFNAYRTDEADFGRLFRKAVAESVANRAEDKVLDESFDKFPGAI